jgi:hypothetical protein
MEPLTPQERERILRDNPQATDADLEEFEELLSARFAFDPDYPSDDESQSEAEQIEARIAELAATRFPNFRGRYEDEAEPAGEDEAGAS